MFIVVIILAIVAIFCLVVGSRAKSRAAGSRDPDAVLVARGAKIVGGILLAIAAVFLFFASSYTQDAGESKVQVSWTGELIGQTTTPGLHFKAPWVGVRTFDVRNNTMAFVGPSEAGGQPSYTGGATTGPQITFQDREGVTGNMDITLRYSIEADAVLDVYREFQTQQNFVSKVIAEGVRSEARSAPAGRGTLAVYNERAAVGLEIAEALRTRWEGLGIIVEEVSIQEIRYSDDVKARFDEAQSARIAIEKAKADQETARVNAQTKVIEAQGVADSAVVAAQGQAEANRLLSESLTDAILRQRYIDALANGNSIYVVPDGSTPFVGTR